MKNLLIVGLLVFGFAGIVFALPITRSEQNVNPFITSTYWLGTTTPSTLSWKGLIVDQICLAGDCQTTWSAGAGEVNTASSLGTGLNLYDSKSGVDLRFNSLAA